MHPNSMFEWRDEATLFDFIRTVSFSTIFFGGPKGPQVVHAPVTVHSGRRLRFHLSRSNRVVPALDGSDVLLSCLGPDAYISPDWYGSPDQVPTWNYVAVECEGQARQLGGEELVEQLDRLADEQETRLAPKAPWTRHKMIPERFEAMTKAILCFEIEVREIRGTRKLGQNKKGLEREGMLAGLAAAGKAEMAEFARAELERS